MSLENQENWAWALETYSSKKKKKKKNKAFQRRP